MSRLVDLDPLDAAILQCLREDARLSYRKIAERVGSTTPTVSARVKRLEDVGIIQGYTVRVRGDAEPPAPDAAPERVPVTCHECKGPVLGAGVHARFDARAHVFCCRNCLGAFRGRFERARAGAG